MGYQVGVTPLQMVAAVSAVANGGELRRAARRPRGLSRRPPLRRSTPKVVRRADQRRHRRDADDDHGRSSTRRHRRSSRRFPATRSPARPARPTSWSTAATRHPTTTRRSSGFVPSRNPALAIIVVIDSPRAERQHRRRRSSAPIFKRIAEAALRYLGDRADDQSGAAGAGRAPRQPSTCRPRVAPRGTPVVSLVADDRPGTVPDLRGMSAREAMRTLVKLGLTARMSGDGFVVVAGSRRRARRSSRRRLPPRARARRLGAACAGEHSHDLGRAARRARAVAA